MAQLVKNPPAMGETWVQSLGLEDPLKKGKTSHSSILPWTIPWTVQSRDCNELDTTERLHFLRCCITGGFFTTEPPGKSIILFLTPLAVKLRLLEIFVTELN